MNTAVFEGVHIQEPPVEELRKRKPSFIRGCMTSCGCFGLLIFSSMLFLHAIAKPEPEELSKIPEHITRDIPMYQANYADKIELIRGKEKNKTWEQLAYVPKILSAPVAGFIDTDPETTEGFFDRFIEHIRMPVTDPIDEVTITWVHLPVARAQVEAFYTEQLTSAGFIIEETPYITKRFTLHFHDPRDILKGELTIEDRTETPEVEYITLTIATPSLD